MRTTSRQTRAMAITVTNLVREGETFNTFSHLLGSALCLGIAVALVAQAAAASQPVRALGLAVYAATAAVGFFCSAVFHAAPDAHRSWLRRFDRASIFLALGGFHVANIAAVMPQQAWLASLPVVAFVAHAVRRELTDGDARRNVLLYLAAGWGGCLLWAPQLSRLPAPVLGREFAGAVLITLGAVAYRADHLPKNHQLWHVLALAGSLCQIAALAETALA